MNKNEIREIIFRKQNTKEVLTEEEEVAALMYFSEEEIECMVMPNFNHDACFSKKHTISIPRDQIEQINRASL